MSNQIFTGGIKKLAIGLIAIGLVGALVGFFMTPSDIDAVKSILAHHGHDASDAHAEHALHQMQNKPWTALYVAALFFTLLSLGAAFFFAIQYVARAGWSVLVIRVFDSVARFLPVGAAIVLLLLILSSFHANHMFHWMVDGIDVEGHENYDAIIAGKTGYLNVAFFLIRAVLFVAGWIFIFNKIAQHSYKQDEVGSMTQTYHYNQSVKFSAVFLVFFAVTESMMSWDWIMSIDTHWFSTLFGWYVFASFFVSALAMITLIVINLKKKGHLQGVTTSHLHDLAKFMFAFSIFWTYLWFSQFILIWYAQIPEEVTYYMQRWDEYKGIFWTTMLVNFSLPFLMLVSSDLKRKAGLVTVAGLIIIIGHWMDFYLMISPGTVGEHWYIGPGEIGSFLLFLGLFILVVFKHLDKNNLTPTGHPLYKESVHHHV